MGAIGFRNSTQNLIKEIETVCHRCGRDPATVTIVAVSKTFPAETVNRYLDEVRGLFPVPVLGENKVQEVLNKKSQLGNHRLHFIGHLQSNKVRIILPHIDCLHSLDSIKLADTLEKELSSNPEQSGLPRLPVLIQANTTGEESKFGGGWEKTRDLFHHTLKLPHLEIQGLMTLAPFTEEETVIRNCFRTLRDWRDRLNQEVQNLPPGASAPPKLTELSMGMSHDYRIALEEGATMIRVGSALFGERSYKKPESA